MARRKRCKCSALRQCFPDFIKSIASSHYGFDTFQPDLPFVGFCEGEVFQNVMVIDMAMECGCSSVGGILERAIMLGICLSPRDRVGIVSLPISKTS
jgi:hypothetical protein